MADGLSCDPSDDEGCSEQGEAGEGAGEVGDPKEGWQCWADGAGFAGAVGDCFESAAQGMYSTLVSESSLLATAVSAAAAFPSGGGECPSAVVELSGESFDLWEVPCGFLDDVEAVLSPLFLVLWSFFGLRILLSIPGGE
jgi:hypothetical protein